jgi:pentatricopeptide repeat protein
MAGPGDDQGDDAGVPGDGAAGHGGRDEATTSSVEAPESLEEERAAEVGGEATNAAKDTSEDVKEACEEKAKRKVHGGCGEICGRMSVFGSLLPRVQFYEGLVEWSKLASIMINTLGRLGKVEIALDVFDNAQKAGFGNNVYAYAAIVSAYELWREALKVFHTKNKAGQAAAEEIPAVDETPAVEEEPAVEEIGDAVSAVESTDKEIAGSEPSTEGSTDNIDSEALEPEARWWEALLKAEVVRDFY